MVLFLRGDDVAVFFGEIVDEADLSRFDVIPDVGGVEVEGFAMIAADHPTIHIPEVLAIEGPLVVVLDRVPFFRVSGHLGDIHDSITVSIPNPVKVMTQGMLDPYALGT